MEHSANMLLTTQVLQAIEALPEHATGALRFGDRGVVLVDSRRICWAIASNMPQRLTDLLRKQRNPPLERSFLAAVFRDAQARGIPMGEALLATGEITEHGLRAAVLGQVTAAIARIASDAVSDLTFEPYDGLRYDTRFVFRPAVVFERLGALGHRVGAALARRDLAAWLDPATTALAFARDTGSRIPTVVAMANAESLSMSDLLAIGDKLRAPQHGSSSAQLRSLRWSDHAQIVAWNHGELSFAALCADERAAGLSMRLAQRFEPAHEVVK